MTTFKRVCSWCGIKLGPDKKVNDGKNKVEVTHGICKGCAKNVV